MTMALTSLSPAIDNGSAAGAPATDQRGCPRISGAAPDIGAYERFNTADIVFRDGFEGAAACLETRYRIGDHGDDLTRSTRCTSTRT